jgi:hypothetical protein
MKKRKRGIVTPGGLGVQAVKAVWGGTPNARGQLLGGKGTGWAQRARRRSRDGKRRRMERRRAEL